MATSTALHENSIFTPRFIAGWVFFTAAAGFVNATAVLAGDNVVSHVTGSVTAVATEPGTAVRIGLVVLAFLFGAMLAGFAKKLLTSWRGYVLPPAVVAVVLLSMSILGRAGAFGEFGGDNDVKGYAFPMLAMLAFAMGMLNASVGMATANKIRVTHLTGPLTDLAGNIVKGETNWVALRVGTLVAFVAGGLLAVKIGDRFEFDTFSIGAMLIATAIGLTGMPSAEAKKAEKSEEEEAHVAVAAATATMIAKVEVDTDDEPSGVIKRPGALDQVVTGPHRRFAGKR